MSGVAGRHSPHLFARYGPPAILSGGAFPVISEQTTEMENDLNAEQVGDSHLVL